MEATTKSALVFIDEVPHYELTGNELIFRDEQNDPKKPIYFHMRPYAARDLKDAVGKLRQVTRVAGKDRLVIEKADLSVFRPIFDKNFIRMSNVAVKGGGEPTIEQQKAWLARNPGLCQRVVNDAYTSVVLIAGNSDEIGEEQPDVRALAEGESAEGLFEIGLDDGESKAVNRFRLYSLERGQNVEIRFEHHFRKESESDRLAYDRATNREINRKQGTTSIAVNYDVIESLYNRLIQRVDGFVVNGQPCTESNRDAWVNVVPFWIKKVSIEQLFDESALKNV